MTPNQAAARRNAIAARLKTLRAGIKRKQSEVAHLTRMPIHRYKEYEQGRRDLQGKDAITLARFYRVAIDDLLCAEIDNAPPLSKKSRTGYVEPYRALAIDTIRQAFEDEAHEWLVANDGGMFLADLLGISDLVEGKLRGVDARYYSRFEEQER